MPFQRAKYAKMKLVKESIIHENGSYLRDSVFAASDGLITTFAVVAGAQGAGLGPSIVVVMGFANLFADGISMSSGTYLGTKSETEFEQKEGDYHINRATPLKQALVSFVSFDFAGLIPLIPFIIRLPGAFSMSVGMVFLSLFIIGSIRGKYTGKNWLRSGIESLSVGGVAALVAYYTGDIIEKIIMR